MREDRVEFEMAAGNHLECALKVQTRQAEGAGDDEFIVMNGVDVELGLLALREAGEQAHPSAVADEADRIIGESGNADRGDGGVGAQSAGGRANLCQ